MVRHCVLWPNVVQLLFADLLSTKLHVKWKQVNIRSVALFYVLIGEKGRQKRRGYHRSSEADREVLYTQVAIQTGDPGSIRKLRERVQLK